MLHLHGHKFEAFGLKPLDDLSNDAPLHTIGLDGNECALLLLGHDSTTKAEKGKKKTDEGNTSLQEEHKAEESLTALGRIWHSHQWGGL